MAKKTLNDLKKCPIDFLYLWASDGFISQLGNKAKIIKQKKYNQFQTLWKIMADNEKFQSSTEGNAIYARWTNELAQAIEDVYGMTPAQILNDLALGKTVFGKNFQKGLYGVGDAESEESTADSVVFRSNTDVYVDPTTGKIKDKSGKDIKNQTAIYGSNGEVTGYSVVKGGTQYQSTLGASGYVAYTYSNAEEIRRANGALFAADEGTFWQNANNYMPIINQVMEWVTTIVNSTFANTTILTSQNTLPRQTEWVEEDNNSGLLFGLAAAAGVAMVVMGGKDKKKKEE